MWPTRVWCAWFVTSLLGNSFSRKSVINLDLFSFDAQLAKGGSLRKVGKGIQDGHNENCRVEL